MAYQLLLNLSEHQKEKLFNRKKETNIPVSVQIRQAIDQYIKKNEE